MPASLRAESAHLKQFACVNCTRRKVKCDKNSPTCGSCVKTKLTCVYHPPAPPRRKRKISTRLDFSTPATSRRDAPATPRADPGPQHILQEQEHAPSTAQPFLGARNEARPRESVSGTLLTATGRSTYITSSHWQNLGNDELQRLSRDWDAHGSHARELPTTPAEVSVSDSGVVSMQPLTAAFMGYEPAVSLLEYHPSHEDAIALCKVFCDRVDPICKLLHVPSIWTLIEMTSQEPASISPANECVVFAIYHFAVFACSEQDCSSMFRQSRSFLRARYAFATRQALANVSFLRSSNLSVLQALVLFLLAARDLYDPHTYWILTGIAVRISQRTGLHKDGEKSDLSPFEVEMRRRLFYQLLPLDGLASKMSGTGIVTLGLSDALDTQLPTNVDDAQLWPQMTEPPEPRKSASEMSFCLARMCIGRLFFKISRAINQGLDHVALAAMIGEAETEVENRFIRYCDMVNPLHVLTAVVARSAITAMRIRAMLPKVRANTITAAERKELLGLALKILDADATAYSYPGMNNYMWHLSSFFLYGTWDSLIFAVTSLRHPDILPLSIEGTDAAWDRVSKTYANHPQLLEVQKQPLHIAVGRLCVKAWDVNPPSRTTLNQDAPAEPDFVTALRESSKANAPRKEQSQPRLENITVPPNQRDSDADALFGAGLDMDPNFTLDTVDWSFWEELITDYQPHGG